MPKMDGLEFRKRLRADRDTAFIPFIFLSAKNTAEDELKGLKLGVDDYVGKPPVMAVLLERMEIAVERAARARAANPEADFGGRLDRMTISDAFQIIESNQKTGELIYSDVSRNRIGFARFQKGNIVHAEYRTLAGEEAVYGMMGEKTGFLEFIEREASDKETISVNNVVVLLKGYRMQDEAAQLLKTFPDETETLAIRSLKVPPQVIERCGKRRLQFIFSMIERGLSLEEILDNRKISRIRTASILYDMLREKLITRKSSDA
jgi:DNA-binding response OmpR family regulator